MNLFGIAVTFAAVSIVALSPRRGALLAFVAAAIFLPQEQQVQVAGVNFFAFRFVEVVAFLRVCVRGEISGIAVQPIDKVLIAFFIYLSIVFVIRSRDGVAYQVGLATDAMLCYFSFRALIATPDDWSALLTGLAALLVLYSALVFYESVSHNNPFSILGVPNRGEFWVRGGRLRCFGSFRHPSLLGTLGAVFLPLYVGLYLDNFRRRAAFVGIVCCLAIVWASNSGAPASCVGVGLLGWMLWKFRRNIRAIRYSIAIALLAAALCMDSPIWYLPAKASSFSGGDGWHRSYLMDVAFSHFDTWWLAGMPIRETANWFPYIIENTGGADMTNQFLSYAISGGVVAMGLYIYLLVTVFRAIGKVCNLCSSYAVFTASGPVFWGLGVAIVVHIFNWIGITYFDQTYALWYLQLAAASSLTSFVRATSNDSTFQSVSCP